MTKPTRKRYVYLDENDKAKARKMRADGYNNREIADALGVTTRTVLRKFKDDPPRKTVERTAKLPCRNPAKERNDLLLAFITERDGTECYLCKRPIDLSIPCLLRNQESASIDHVIPVSKGGENTPSKVRLVHRRCNTAKGVKLLGDNATATETNDEERKVIWYD